MPDKKDVSWWISTPNALTCCDLHLFTNTHSGMDRIREKRRNALTKHILMLKWTYMTICSCENTRQLRLFEIQEGEPMKFFIDTANVDEIRKANDMGVICGVTTNPSLIAKEGKDYVETLKEIASIVDGPISGEVKATTTDAEGMIAEGREIAKIHPNMVVKIPMTIEGLKATKVLASEGIKVNVTLIFSANQALLAARAGAAYVSPFLGRLDDISQPGIDLIDTVAEIFALHDIETEIIAASVRHTMHVTECALAGADIATVPYKVIEQMTHHPLTDQGIEKFRKDYEAVFGK